jgi:thiol-disulfide isomerase/thioredoxin
VVICKDSETGAPAVKDASSTLDDRVRVIYEKSQLDAALEAAGDRLVVLELMKDSECETGLWEVEDHWTPPTEQHERRMNECAGIRHSFVKMAASSLSARFLSVMVGAILLVVRAVQSRRIGIRSCTRSETETSEVQESDEHPTDIARSLNITTFPAVVFFKDKHVVWQTQGSAGMTGDIAEGILYFGGKHYVSSPSVAELGTQHDLDAFLAAESPAQLKMVMTGTHMCSPCIHVYPSFVTLAANFSDNIEFARLEGDEEDMKPIFEGLNILEVPTFLLYKGGKEVARLVSSRRGDLIGFLLNISMQHGIQPPKPK